MGCGGIAGKFADALKYVGDAELLAVGSRTQAKADAFGAVHGVPRRYGSYAQLASDSDVDMIYVATPHHLHAENTILCLNAGKGVLCEKPLAANAAQGQAMIDCARANRRFLMEAMWTRFLPLMERLRELLADGAIGRPQMLTADFVFRSRDPAEKQRIRDPHLAGGALLDVGVYPLALASMVFGRPARVCGAAMLGATGVDEHCAMMLSYDGGRLATLCAAIDTETPHEATLMGDAGMIRLHRSWWCGDTLTLTPPGRSEQTMHLPTHQNGFVYQIQAVQADLRNGRLENTQMPLDESLNILCTMDALRRQWGQVYPFE